MLIKILSMQRVINYGSFMQAYALKRTFENLGHVVEFVDFKPGEPRHIGQKVHTSSKVRKLLNLPRFLVSPNTLLQKRNFKTSMTSVFEHNAWPLLGLGATQNLDYSGDLYVIGSDEVFNYTQNHVFGYVPAFFGHGISAKTLISYAASAGYANPDDVINDGMANEISSGFCKFDAISVRDDNTYSMVRTIAEREPTLVLDPTLIYDFAKETSQAKFTAKEGEYLLVYAYTGRLDENEDVTQILNYAKRKGLKVVSVGFYHEWCDENLVVTPFELLKLFKHAAEIITDTFHGTIFSIKNKKSFVSLLRHQSKNGSNSNKLGYLLSQFGLESRINSDLSELDNHLSTPIDYTLVESRLAPLQAQSLAFINNSLATAESKR